MASRSLFLVTWPSSLEVQFKRFPSSTTRQAHFQKRHSPLPFPLFLLLFGFLTTLIGHFSVFHHDRGHVVRSCPGCRMSLCLFFSPLGSLLGRAWFLSCQDAGTPLGEIRKEIASKNFWNGSVIKQWSFFFSLGCPLVELALEGILCWNSRI